MVTAENRQGRLVETRIAWPLTEAEVLSVSKQHRILFERMPGLCVAVSDLRKSKVFPSDVAQELIRIMSRVADRIERSAFLLPDSAILGLQLERAIEEGGGGMRRIFRDPEELKDWLGEALTEAEKLRLRAFLWAGGEW